MDNQQKTDNPQGSSTGDSSVPSWMQPAQAQDQSVPQQPVPTYQAPTYQPPTPSQTRPSPSQPVPQPEPPPTASQQSASQPQATNPLADWPQTPSQQTTDQPPQPGNGVFEPAPTDLSHLAGENTQPPPEIYSPSIAPVENPMVTGSQTPASVIPEVITTDQTPHGIPKLVLIGGIILILLVTAGSAYFILNIGRSQPSQTSTKSTKTTSETQKQATPTPKSESGSSEEGFGSLNGPTSSPSSSPKSALDRLKERQKSPSPAP